MNKNKPSILLILFLSVFIFLVISIVQKSIFLSQQKKLSEFVDKAQIYKDIVSDLEIKISELSGDARIIEIAKRKLNMEFPDSKDIICVQRYRASSGNFNYSFLNFISPEAIAADK
jgi:cell division protein FtsL